MRGRKMPDSYFRVLEVIFRKLESCTSKKYGLDWIRCGSDPSIDIPEIYETLKVEDGVCDYLTIGRAFLRWSDLGCIQRFKGKTWNGKNRRAVITKKGVNTILQFLSRREGGN